MEINKIIVSRTDKIGDLVLSIPSFYMVKKLYPEAHLTVLVRNYNYDVVKNLPYVDQVIKIDDYGARELYKRVKEVEADVFIALYSDKKVAKLAKESKASLRIGPYSKLSSYFAYNKGIRQKRSKSIKNEAEYNLDLIKTLNPEKFDREFEVNTLLYYEEEHKLYVENYIKEEKLGEELLIIHPFSGGSAKNLTDKQYSSLISRILESFESLEVVVTSGEGDADRAKAIVADCSSRRAKAFVNKGSLLNLAAMIDKAKVYIGTSTGPTHLAGSLGKDIIGIYPIKATQAPLRWGVYGNERVNYILPEGKVEEDYTSKEFLSWGEKDVNQILKYIEEVID